MSKKVIILGGGTQFHVRPHFSIAAPAYGKTAWELEELLLKEWPSASVELYLTRMAGGDINPNKRVIDTNQDVAKFIEEVVVGDPDVRAFLMPAALCDFEVIGIDGDESEVPFVGKEYPRLRSSSYSSKPLQLSLTPAQKIISLVRKTRKDIFLVGFKSTTNATVDSQFSQGLQLLKQSSCNLVLANDLSHKLNMIITPEQAKYHVTTDRRVALEGLVDMLIARAADKFTHSTVVPGSVVPWDSAEIPGSLRKVVNHLVSRGAYRPFLGATVGHFAVKVGEGRFLTSVRKTNFNNLHESGLVRVEVKGDDEVVAYGAKPSVGGQSQRIIFANHPGMDCIAHAHIQLKPGSSVPVRAQWPHECGSHACGQNTSDGLKDFGGIKAVFLDKHGPNIVFNRNIDPQRVIDFIEDNFDVEHQTSELD